MQHSEEKDIPQDVWPPPISGQSGKTPAPITHKKFHSSLKRCALGTGLGIFSGFTISLLASIARVAFSRNGYDLHPQIYYVPLLVEAVVSTLMFSRRKSVAICFAFGSLGSSLLIATVLTIVDGLDSLD